MEAWVKLCIEDRSEGHTNPGNVLRHRPAKVYQLLLQQSCFSENSKAQLRSAVWKASKPIRLAFDRKEYAEPWEYHCEKWRERGLPVPPYPWPSARPRLMNDGRIEKAMSGLRFVCPFCDLECSRRICAQWVFPEEETYTDALLCEECSRMRRTRLQATVGYKNEALAREKRQARAVERFNARKSTVPDRINESMKSEKSAVKKANAESRRRRRELERAAYVALEELGLIEQLEVRR